MLPSDELKQLAKGLNDKSRKTTVIGRRALVPLKFDDTGSPLNKETFNPSKHLKSLNLDELRFLKAWRESEWDFEKACKETLMDPDKAKRCQKKVQAFREEDAITRALAEIPTPTWVAAKHVENIFDGGKLNDSQQKSLQETAKIVGAYKPTTNVNINANFLEMPKLSPEQEKAAREFFDTVAVQEDHAA